MPKIFPLNRLETHFKQVLQYAPGLLGNEAVNFFLDSFKKQGWLGNSFEPWARRRNNGRRNKGRSILIDSGRLRRSIRITGISAGIVTIGTDVPYAQAHNEGVRNRSVIVKAFTRNTYTKEKLGSGKFTKNGKERMKTVQRISGTIQVKSHGRRVNIVKRQFMGNSPYLDKILTRRLTAELMKGLR